MLRDIWLYLKTHNEIKGVSCIMSSGSSQENQITLHKTNDAFSFSFSANFTLQLTLKCVNRVTGSLEPLRMELKNWEVK